MLKPDRDRFGAARAVGNAMKLRVSYMAAVCLLAAPPPASADWATYRDDQQNWDDCSAGGAETVIRGCTALILEFIRDGYHASLARIFNNRGVAFALLGDIDRAVLDFDQAIRLKPDYAEAFGHRGFAYQLKGNVDQAVEDFERALRFKPGYANALMNNGLVYTGNRNLDPAFADLAEAIAVSQAYRSSVR